MKMRVGILNSCSFKLRQFAMSVFKNSSTHRATLTPSARKMFCRERTAADLIKLRPRAEVQPRIARYSVQKAQRALRAQSERLFGSRARGSLPCRSSLINRLVPRVHPPSPRNSRNAHDDDGDNERLRKKKRVRAFGISQSPQREEKCQL